MCHLRWVFFWSVKPRVSRLLWKSVKHQAHAHLCAVWPKQADPNPISILLLSLWAYGHCSSTCHAGPARWRQLRLWIMFWPRKQWPMPREHYTMSQVALFRVNPETCFLTPAENLNAGCKMFLKQWLPLVKGPVQNFNLGSYSAH